jgi:c-di-GMP-binding flagellar brake protein YcgR
MSKYNLVPVRHRDMEVGKPLPWPVYDWNGKLLLASGVVIESPSQLVGLIDSGFIYDSRWDTDVMKPVAPVKPKKPPEKPSVEETKADKEILMDLDEVAWTVGESLYLQLADNQAIRYSVRLIGYVKNKTVFVTAPLTDGKFEFIRDGQTFVVRAFSGKKAFAFIAAAVKSVHTPHPYLHLSYPRKMSCTVVRRGIRAQVKIIASVSLGEPERVGATTLTDLSTGGMSCIMKEPMGMKGEEGRVKFKVHVAESDEFVNLKAVLRSVAPAEYGEGFRHGFEFIDTTAHEKLILSAFVHQTIIETT